MKKRFKLKGDILLQALGTMQRAINVYQEFGEKNPEAEHGSMEDSILIGLADSIVRRYAYSLEEFWKYLKTYIEDVLGHEFEQQGPRPTMRAALKFGLIDTLQSTTFMEMLDARNLTSHIYRQEVADAIIAAAPRYYAVMKAVADKLVDNTAKD